MYQETHITSGSFGMNFQIESGSVKLLDFCLTYIVACGQEDNILDNHTIYK